MFKIVVVGCGNMAEQGHCPALKKYCEKYEDAELSACCDVDIKKAENFKNKFGFKKAYSDYLIMLDEIKPDVVSLLCPVDFTCKLAESIMKKGFNIILEKPPGKNIDELNTLIARADKSKVSVRTAFNRRYSPLLIKMKELIKESGEKIMNITYQMYRFNRLDKEFETTAIHAVDAVKYIAEADYEHIAFDYQKYNFKDKAVKNIYMSARFENNIYAQISIVPIGGTICERATVNTPGCTYFLELPFWDNIDMPGKLTVVKNAADISVITSKELCDSLELFEISGFYEENRSFFEYLRKGNPAHSDLSSAIQSVEIEDIIKNLSKEYKKNR